MKPNKLLSRFKLKPTTKNRLGCRVLRGMTYASAGLVFAVLLYIIFFIFMQGTQFISWQFLFGEYNSRQNPSILPAIQGTLMLIAIALSIAVPIGIFTAIFLVEYKLKTGFVRWLRVAVETLAGIPSIVYGLFGYIFFVIILGWGFSMAAGGITLAIMVLPMVIRTTEESLLSVPMTYREASYSFGATRVRTIFRVVLPSAMGGILSGIILAIGRVISESAVLLLTIGCIPNVLPTIDGPGISLAVSVYYFSNVGNPEAAAATAVVLIVLVVAINMLAMLASRLLNRGNMKGNA